MKQPHGASDDCFDEDELPADPCFFVLFGATGDLTARKIAPALYQLYCQNKLHPQTVVLGVARKPHSDEKFREDTREAIRRYSRTGLDEKTWDQFSRQWHYQVVHTDEPSEFITLRKRLEDLEKKYFLGGKKIFYLATLPSLFSEIAENLGQAQLNCPGCEDSFVRLIVEKPFGQDLDSAQKLNASLRRFFDESQIYRIDHYLGKETVRNMLVFRFANAVINPLFHRNFVDHVQITTAETVGMESRRGPYYETVGALRDMIQNHMLQLMALTAMDAPDQLTCDDIRCAKSRLLKEVVLPTPEEIRKFTVRGQYLAANGQPAYREENGVAPDSETETYAAIRLLVDNDRWAGVPFYLRTGKQLAKKASQVLVVFKRENDRLFPRENCDMRGPNRLAIRLTPDEGISLTIDSKVPATQNMLRPVKMDFAYKSAFESASPEAYEHLLLDAMNGDQTLFIRDDETEASWKIIDQVRSAWNGDQAPPLNFYPCGSWGPDQAEMLFNNPYKRWQPL